MRHLSLRPRGSIIIIVLICVIIIAGISGALMQMAKTQTDSTNLDWAELQAFQLAESAMAQARATLAAQTGNNGDNISLAMRESGLASDAVTWNSSTNAWQPVTGALPTWTSTSDDVGIGGGQTGLPSWGAGDGFPTGPEPVRQLPGEPNFFAFRQGSQSLSGGSPDEHYYAIAAQWWGSDGVDNNGDGVTDTDAFESRTYTIRATGIYQDKYVELETILTRDPPPPPVDPNNPPAGFLAAISIQVSAGSGAPAGTVNIKNNSAANSIDGHDNATSIAGASAPSSSNDTHGILLAASGASLSLSSDNDSGVTGVSGPPSFNNSGQFIGDIIDTIADGVKSAAVDTGGNPSDDATNQDWGSTSNLKLVYHDFDQHGSLAVSNPGFGILVVDASSISSTPAVTFSGAGSTWEGIVIVRVKNNLAPSGPNGAIKATGAGSTATNAGSMVIYGKQNANFSGGDVYKNNGNRPTKFSLGAIQSALQAFNNQVPPTTTGIVGAPLVWRPIRQPGMSWATE